MANKRELKKQVRFICGDIAAECLLTGEYVDCVDSNKMWEIVGEVAALQTNALKSISFSFDKVPSDFGNRREYNVARAAYFKKAFASFREKFNAHILEIVKEMNAAVPKDVRAANVK